MITRAYFICNREFCGKWLCGDVVYANGYAAGTPEFSDYINNIAGAETMLPAACCDQDGWLFGGLLILLTDEFYSNLRNQAIRLRKQSGDSTASTAYGMGLSQRTYEQFENGDRKATIGIADKIARLYGLSLYDLVVGCTEINSKYNSVYYRIEERKLCFVERLSGEMKNASGCFFDGVNLNSSAIGKVFWNRPGVNASLNRQGYVYFVSHLFSDMGFSDRQKITDLCKACAGENYLALEQYMTTLASAEFICKWHHIGRDTLKNDINKYYELFPIKPVLPKARR